MGCMCGGAITSPWPGLWSKWFVEQHALALAFGLCVGPVLEAQIEQASSWDVIDHWEIWRDSQNELPMCKFSCLIPCSLTSGMLLRHVPEHLDQKA